MRGPKIYFPESRMHDWPGLSIETSARSVHNKPSKLKKKSSRKNICPGQFPPSVWSVSHEWYKFSIFWDRFAILLLRDLWVVVYPGISSPGLSKPTIYTFLSPSSCQNQISHPRFIMLLSKYAFMFRHPVLPIDFWEIKSIRLNSYFLTWPLSNGRIELW